jgi:hypothetical protein
MYELISIHTNPPSAPLPYDAYWKELNLRVSGETKAKCLAKLAALAEEVETT